MRQSLKLAAALIALAGAPLAAQGIADWDGDGDGVLSESEFSGGILDSGIFEDWDADSDGVIGYTELSDGLYRTWDANDDGEVSVDEWDTAVDLWFGEEAVNLSVEAWDADGNGVISESELDAALEETNLLARLGGGDGTVDEDELSDGLFDIADADADDAVAPEEEGFFSSVAEFFTSDAAPSFEPSTPDEEVDDVQLIEEGEAFMQLPIPCGDGDTGCQVVAERFCTTLGYGDPIEFLDVAGEIYAIRCQDEI